MEDKNQDTKEEPAVPTAGTESLEDRLKGLNLEIDKQIVPAVEEIGIRYCQGRLESYAQAILRGEEVSEIGFFTHIYVRNKNRDLTLGIILSNELIYRFLIPGMHQKWFNTRDDPITQSTIGNDKKAEVLFKAGHLDEAIALLAKECREASIYDKDAWYYGFKEFRNGTRVYDAERKLEVRFSYWDECFSVLKLKEGYNKEYSPERRSSVWLIDDERPKKLQTRVKQIAKKVIDKKLETGDGAGLRKIADFIE